MSPVCSSFSNSQQILAQVLLGRYYTNQWKTLIESLGLNNKRQCNLLRDDLVKWHTKRFCQVSISALTFSGRLARTAYHEKPSVFPGGTPGVTWLKKRFTWKMNRQYGNFFNESKIDRIRHNVQKTGSQLLIRFPSNYILSFVNRERNQ